ncbi:MAG: hypothetical protein Q4F05_16920 [bacterium]|nr:hypothetical protein [bacterium]
MRKKLAIVLLCFITITLFAPCTANADMGPKPSVQITFENMGDETCYGTLLSKEESTGPAMVWDGTEETIRRYDLDYDIWKAFVDYKDTDGFYFLQNAWLCSEEKKLDWTYYPPTPFKILLYYPKTNTFVVSDIYERYAFDSLFKVNMEGIDIGSVEAQTPVLVAERSYDYKGEAIVLILRIIATILLEVIIAFLFGFVWTKELVYVAGINVVTQILLNVMLNLVNYNQKKPIYIIIYLLLEVMVIVIEAFFYNKVFNRIEKEPVACSKCVAYALIANVVSFGAGSLLANWLPGMF